MRLNQRAQNVIESVRTGARVIRRTVPNDAENTFRRAETLSGLRRQYEARLGRPRTLQETSAAFRASIRVKRHSERVLIPKYVEETEGE